MKIKLILAALAAMVAGGGAWGVALPERAKPSKGFDSLNEEAKDNINFAYGSCKFQLELKLDSLQREKTVEAVIEACKKLDEQTKKTNDVIVDWRRYLTSVSKANRDCVDVVKDLQSKFIAIAIRILGAGAEAERLENERNQKEKVEQEEKRKQEELEKKRAAEERLRKEEERLRKEAEAKRNPSQELFNEIKAEHPAIDKVQGALRDGANMYAIIRGGDLANYTPLELAILWKEIEVVRVLISDPTFDRAWKNSDGKTILEYADSLSDDGRDPKIIDILEEKLGVKEARQREAEDERLENERKLKEKAEQEEKRNQAEQAQKQKKANEQLFKLARGYHEDSYKNYSDEEIEQGFEEASKAGADINGIDSLDRSVLQNACKSGTKHLIEILLLQAGIKVDRADGNGRTPLHYAVLGDQPEIVSMLVNSKKIDVNMQDAKGKTALHYASQAEDKFGKEKLEKCVEELLKAKEIDVNKPDKEGKTPLFCAIEDVQITKIGLLAKDPRVKINEKNDSGDTPLLYALQRPYYVESCVKALLERKDIDVKLAGKDGLFPLHLAVNKKEEEIVAMLLARGADVNGVDPAGKTPLHYAVQTDNKKIITLLVNAKGIDINKLDKIGNAPLHYVVDTPYLWAHETVKLLLTNKGIKINLPGPGGKIPLHIAVANCNRSVVELLLQNGADIKALDDEGKTPLLYAVVLETSYLRPPSADDASRLVGLLLTNRADVNQTDKKGKTPLHCAVEAKNSWAIAKLFEAAEIKPNELDFEGKAPLHYAAMSGSKYVVEELLKGKLVNVNVTDLVDNKTPLHYAAIHFNAAPTEAESKVVVQALLKAKADPTILDNDKKRPLDYIADKWVSLRGELEKAATAKK